MTKRFEANLRIVRSIAPAIARNLFSFSYFVIIAVVGLLFAFKDFQGGLFLGAAIFLAILSGLVQDIRAHITSCTDRDLLNTWIRQAATAHTIDDIQFKTAD